MNGLRKAICINGSLEPTVARSKSDTPTSALEAGARERAEALRRQSETRAQEEKARQQLELEAKKKRDAQARAEQEAKEKAEREAKEKAARNAAEAKRQQEEEMMRQQVEQLELEKVRNIVDLNNLRRKLEGSFKGIVVWQDEKDPNVFYVSGDGKTYE